MEGIIPLVSLFFFVSVLSYIAFDAGRFRDSAKRGKQK